MGRRSETPPSPSIEARAERRRLARARLRRRRAIAAAGTLAIAVAGAVTAVVAAHGNGHHRRPQSTAARLPPAPATAPPPTRPAPAPARPLSGLRGRTIAIDPGHNGGNAAHSAQINRLVDAGTLRKACDTVGAETASGYSESAYNLDVALRLARILRAAGARVVLTRTTNGGWGPCITERAAIGNRAHADAALSIHADGGPSSERGFHVIYPPSIPGLTDDIAAASYRLALEVRTTFAAGTGMPYATYIGRNGLDRRSDLGGLNLSDVPKVFVETGNMRNATDAALLERASFRERVARALARGLGAFEAPSVSRKP